MANIYTYIKMFDAENYFANNPDLAEAGLTVENVGIHYEQYGAAEGREPNTWFDVAFYREKNADLAELSDGELLFHFAQYGAAEGRSPNPAFGEGQTIDANLYLEYALANQDLLDAFGIATDATRLTDEQQANVASHFFIYGITEGREGGVADVFAEANVDPIESLTEALAIQAEGGELPEGYTLSDTALVLEADTIAAIGEQITAAQEVVDGAANAEELEFAPEYTIEDSAENVLAAAAEENPLVADASLITLTDETITAAQRDALLKLGFDAEALPELAPLSLTEALTTLADAQDAKTDYLETAAKNETLAESQGLDEDSTTADVENAITAEYAATAGALGSSTGVTSFGDKSAALQDAAIVDARGVLEKAVTTQTAVAEEGMTALLTAVDDAVDALNAALKAEFVTNKAYDEEVTVFQAANTGVVIGDANTNLKFDDNVFGVTDGTDITEVYANNVNGQWVLTPAGKAQDFSRIDDLFAKYDANKAANANSTTQKTALESAVGKVLVAENDAYSVKVLGGNVITGDDSLVEKPDVKVNFTAAGTELYETKADAQAGDGKEEVFTVKFAGAASTDGTAIKVTFDGIDIALAQSDTAAQIAVKVAGGSFTNWNAVITDAGDGVTFTAKTPGAVTDPTAADFVFADDGAAGTASATNVTIITQGVDAAAPMVDAKAPNAAALNTALGNLKDFNELAADFENARELNDGLEAVELAITEATNAITDSVEDGGLGINLLDGTTFTAGNDVYLFNEEDGNVNLTNFGKAGQDNIFFNDTFTLVALGDDKITDKVGDQNVLEIFWVQNGNNVDMYVEAETFAGNGSTEADLTKVTLVGVNGSDIQDSLDNGLLTLGDFVA